MDIKLEGEKLLTTHLNLYKKLLGIPDKREIEFREELKDGKRFGKPRFIKSQYEWDIELLKKLRDHLQDLWNFFYKYNYWLDETIFPLLAYNSRRISKKSVIFLLEKDIWNTDEVYGKYLIVKSKSSTFISYYRFGTKINEIELSTVNESKIKEWICNDARKQISEQFSFLWSKLETEIQLCIEEKYHKEPKLYITTEYFKEQFELTKKYSKDWPEAAMLSLGRICELWLILALNKKHKDYYEDLIKQAELMRKITKNQGKLLYKIKKNYDHLKHKTYYKIDKDFVVELINQFSKMMSNSV